MLITPILLYMASHILYSTLLRYITSKVKPSFVEDINMVAGFGYLCQYVERLTFMFMYKVTSKIGFDVLFGGGGGFMKNVAVTFSVPKSIYGLPLTGNHYFCVSRLLQKQPPEVFCKKSYF